MFWASSRPCPCCGKSFLIKIVRFGLPDTDSRPRRDWNGGSSRLPLVDKIASSYWSFLALRTRADEFRTSLVSVA
jgi:hypothetical protein